MKNLIDVYAHPKFSQKCINHHFILKYTNKNNPFYQCKHCLTIQFNKLKN